MIFPFLEFWNTEALIAQGVFPLALSLWHVYAVLIRVLISTIFLFIYIRDNAIDSYTNLLILYGAFMTMSVLITDRLISGAAKNALEQIGFACFLLLAYRDNREATVKSIFISSVALMLLSAASVIFTRGEGFVPNLPPESRSFIFGGKNSIFTALLPGILALCICMEDKNKLRWAVCIVCAFGAVLARYIDSSSSTVFFLAATILTLPIGHDYLAKRINPKMYIILFLALLFGTVLTQGLVEGATDLFSSIGRDSSFTGRTTLWREAIDYIKQAPVFGVGTDVPFLLDTGVDAAHPHCIFLELAAKYGLPSALMFTSDALFWVGRAGRKSSDNLIDAQRVCAGLMFLLLWHSLYDTLPFLAYIMMRFMLYQTEQTAEEPGGGGHPCASR